MDQGFEEVIENNWDNQPVMKNDWDFEEVMEDAAEQDDVFMLLGIDGDSDGFCVVELDKKELDEIISIMETQSTDALPPGYTPEGITKVTDSEIFFAINGIENYIEDVPGDYEYPELNQVYKYRDHPEIIAAIRMLAIEYENDNLSRICDDYINTKLIINNKTMWFVVGYADDEDEPLQYYTSNEISIDKIKQWRDVL